MRRAPSSAPPARSWARPAPRRTSARRRLFLGEILTMGVVGYSAGLQGSRGLLTAIVLVIVLGAVLTLLVDLDRPREGFLQVNQQPLVDLLEQIGD